MKSKAKQLKTAAVVRALGATAVGVSLAALVAGMNLGNHNEIFLAGLDARKPGKDTTRRPRPKI